MELSVVKLGNAAAGTVSVSDVAFAREYNEDLVHQVVTAYMAGARQGTRAQKTRADVRYTLGPRTYLSTQCSPNSRRETQPG